LMPSKRNHRDAMLAGKAVDGVAERLGDPTHQGAGGEESTTVSAEEADDAALVLKAGNVAVKVEAVDALYLEGDVVSRTWATVRGILMAGSGRPRPSWAP
jgi:hypothetical protein